MLFRSAPAAPTASEDSTRESPVSVEASSGSATGADHEVSWARKGSTSRPAGPAPTTAAEQALAAMRAAVFGADPMGAPPPIHPTIQAPADPTAPVNASASPDPGELSDFIEISGLLRYDPAAITRIYAGHPRRLIRRLWQTLVPIGLYLVGVGSDWLLGRLRGERVRERSREAATLVASLGPAFIKAGQALSTRPDIIPPVLLEEQIGRAHV